MGTYAADTQVSPDRSRAEIERTLVRYGASAFAYAWEPGRAAVQFAMHERRIRMVVPLPDRHEFALTTAGKPRAATATEAAHEQAVRQRWRALALLVKAQLEAVESGIVTFAEAFLPYTVLPSGDTVAEEIGEQVAAAYALGSVTPLQIEGGHR